MNKEWCTVDVGSGSPTRPHSLTRRHIFLADTRKFWGQSGISGGRSPCFCRLRASPLGRLHTWLPLVPVRRWVTAAAGSSPRACEHRDFLFDPITEAILLNFQIKSRLQVQPEPVASPEVPRQSQGGIGRDGPSTVDDLVDASKRYAKVFREAVLADAQWLEKVFEQDFAWVNGRHFLLTLHVIINPNAHLTVTGS